MRPSCLCLRTCQHSTHPVPNPAAFLLDISTFEGHGGVSPLLLGSFSLDRSLCCVLYAVDKFRSSARRDVLINLGGPEERCLPGSLLSTSAWYLLPWCPSHSNFSPLLYLADNIHQQQIAKLTDWPTGLRLNYVNLFKCNAFCVQPQLLRFISVVFIVILQEMKLSTLHFPC